MRNRSDFLRPASFFQFSEARTKIAGDYPAGEFHGDGSDKPFVEGN
jgi:hypothetical protein